MKASQTTLTSCLRCGSYPMRYDPDLRDPGDYCLSCGYRPREVAIGILEKGPMNLRRRAPRDKRVSNRSLSQ